MSREASLEIPKRSSDTKKMDEVLYQEALDETCTVPIDSLTDFNKNYITSK